MLSILLIYQLRKCANYRNGTLNSWVYIKHFLMSELTSAQCIFLLFAHLHYVSEKSPLRFLTDVYKMSV